MDNLEAVQEPQPCLEIETWAQPMSPDHPMPKIPEEEEEEEEETRLWAAAMAAAVMRKVPGRGAPNPLLHPPPASQKAPESNQGCYQTRLLFWIRAD